MPNIFFGQDLCKKGIKQKKWKYHWILHVPISLETKFQLKLIILNFWIKFAQKEYYRSKTKKSEHHHWILYIRVSLDTKFQLKLTILKFGTKFAQKRYFQLKAAKVHSTIEFCIFELVYLPNFTLNK